MPSRDYHEAVWAAVPPGLEPIAGPQSHGTAAIAWLRHHAIHPLSPHNPEPTGQQHGGPYESDEQ